MSELTPDKVQEMVEQLATLREKLRSTGATAITPTDEWNVLRKEVAVINKKLNAHAALKAKALKAVASGELAS